MSPATILKLPNELLEMIVADAVSLHEVSKIQCAWLWKRLFRSALSVVLVCRRFNQLGTRYLYRVLAFEAHEGTADPRRRLILHSTLRENPGLRAHCQELCVTGVGVPIMKDTAVEAKLLDDITTWLHAARHLVMRGTVFCRNPIFTPECQARHLIDCAIKNMPYLEKITLECRAIKGPELPEIVKRLPLLKNLKVLRVHGLATRSWELDGELRQLGPSLLRSSPLVTLDISGYRGGPENIAHLILVPAKLEHFSLNSVQCIFNPSSWGWSSLFEALEAHQTTLKSLALGGIRSTHFQDIGTHAAMRELTALESLILPRLITRVSPATFGNCLPPNLRLLELTYGRNCYTGFTRECEEWVRDVLKICISRNVPIGTVHIQYEQSFKRGYNGDLIGPHPGNWPWDRLERLKTEFHEFGILIQYDEPEKGKQEVLELMKVDTTREYPGFVRVTLNETAGRVAP